MAQDKVFGSDIIRTNKELKNNLHDILAIEPVKPLEISNLKNGSCEFVPKNDKYYIPKKRLRLKVKTVREIRNLLERDIYKSLPTELEKQQKILLRKISEGASKDEKTRTLARQMLKDDKPISKSAWQMLINLNPENHAYSSQYVLWNGTCIQINGSRGGQSKFVCNYDLVRKRQSLLQRKPLMKTLTKKKGLLQHSLNVKFKPGPLTQKKYLDDSYQKYNIGDIELVQLPKPGLDIYPECGMHLGSCITKFLHNLREVNGIVSQKWAEFAVSTLGSNKNGRAIQLDKECCVTFDLNYKYDQRRLLMRYDVDGLNKTKSKKSTIFSRYKEDNETITQAVENMLYDIIISVEINLQQDNMYTGEDSIREIDTEDLIKTSSNNVAREKSKKKFGELGRLDVTVIRLSDSLEKKRAGVCLKSFCRLGCVCDSLENSVRLKTHCGRLECIFECKCEYSKLSIYDSFGGDDREIISGLVNLDKSHKLKLSKEEQKFHQTVVMTGDKSILLKSQKRNWKAPKKYEDFYSTMCLKAKKKTEKLLTVMELKFNCENIEPWCMVHNLYKCFCGGKFTDRLSSNILSEETTINNVGINNTLETDLDAYKCDETSNKTVLRPRTRKDINVPNEECTKISCSDKNDILELNTSFDRCECARTKPFKRRKHDDLYYATTNAKIKELEEKENALQEKMRDLGNNDQKSLNDSSHVPESLPKIMTIVASCSQDEELHRNQRLTFGNPISEGKLRSLTELITETEHTFPNMNWKLWIEPSLRLYSKRYYKGFTKTSLDPPKYGKVGIYPWEFILDRYHDKKNLFLVTKKKPRRIFMAVDITDPYFRYCVNINDIAFSELHEYPVSVRKIITKASDSLKDHLCILCGMHYCWELLGSVAKVNAPSNTCGSDNNVNEFNSKSLSDIEGNSKSNSTVPGNLLSQQTDINPENSAEQSRWLFMAIGNDFTEIQFYIRGFFVKYISIIKAIDVARLSNKTVRLSSLKCKVPGNYPRFGIYAIPDTVECCAFVGPYEINEASGIEIIDTNTQTEKKRSTGVWITTKKDDNLRVIDNPLSFVSQIKLERTLRPEQTLSYLAQNDKFQYTKDLPKVVKPSKPIKIAKNNNFYHLSSSGVLKEVMVSPQKSELTSNAAFLSNKSLSSSSELNNLVSISPANATSSKTLLPLHTQTNDSNVASILPSPTPEIASQLEVNKEYSSSVLQGLPLRNLQSAMLVLEPDEINKRSLINTVSTTESIETKCSEMNLQTEEISKDVQNGQIKDVYIISDDEECSNIDANTKAIWKYVWIICTTVHNLGWISGRQLPNKYLSFQFPGFKYTDFYPEKEAFVKINQVLCRKIYLAKNICLEWDVVYRRTNLKHRQKLRLKDLGPNIVLTKRGLVHKLDAAGASKTHSELEELSADCNSNNNDDVQFEINSSSIRALDDESELLEKEGDILWDETVSRKSELFETFSKVSSDVRQEISVRLQTIISNANSSEV